MALALDGSGGHSTQTSASPTVTLTTSSSNDVIVLFVTSNDSVTSVSGGGLTWNLRSSINSGGNFLTYYYAIAASPLSSAVITVSMNSSTFTTLDAFGISGANTGSPFDGSVVTAIAPAVAAITTTNANDIIIGGLLTNQTPGAGYTLVPASVPSDFQMAEYQIVSTTQTALNVDTAGATASLTIADAIKQASAQTFVTGWQNNASDNVPKHAISFSAAPAFGRSAPAPTNTNAGIPWFEPPDRQRPATKINGEAPPPIFPAPPPIVTWSFSVGDTTWLRDAPVDYAPAFGRAIVQPVGVSGMAWFAPPDRDRPAFKCRVETPPAIALTPATLPVPIRGMAWFEPPDRDKAPTRITFDYAPAFGRSLTAPVNTISGMAWFEAPDAIRFNRPVIDTAPSMLPAPVVTVSWSFVVPDVFSLRRVPMDVPPAITFAPAALPSIGMAWFEQQDRVQAPAKLRFDAPPAFGRGFAANVGISGMAWFAPPDRDSPSFKVRIEQPAAIALTPSTLPVRVSGMAWFVSLDRDLPPLKMFGDTSMGMGILGISFSPSSFTITRHLSTYGVDLDIEMLPDGTPAPYIPSTDGTPWPPA